MPLNPVTERAMAWPSLADIENKLRQWSRDSADVSFSTIGYSVENRPIWHVRITDANTADDDKQQVLITAYEHGTEQSGTVTALDIIEWLVSDEGLAVRQNQIINILPVVNIDRYESSDGLFNRNDVNLFADYHYDGTPPAQPESRAVFDLMEQLQPDLMISLHGVWMDWEGSGFHRNWTSTGVAFTNCYARCYNRVFVDRVNAAAATEGYPMDHGEEDVERVTPWLPGYPDHSLPTFNHYAGIVDFAYNRYHSLSFVMEIAHPRDGFLRVRQALLMGNERWPYDCCAGYPNRIITAPCIPVMTLNAGGDTAAQRRQSRTLLWQHSRNLMTGFSPRHATHFLGIASRHTDDSAALLDWSKPLPADKLLTYFQKHGIATDQTRAWLKNANLLDQLIFLWSDPVAVNRFKESPHGKSHKPIHSDPALKTHEQPAGASLRFRIDKRTKPQYLLLNDRVLDPHQYKHWQDERYGYVEAELPTDWHRALFALQTTKTPECKMG